MIGRIIHSAARGLALAGGAALGLVVLITVINAAGFVLNAAARPFGATVPGLPGYEDAVSLLVGVAVLFMLPYCQLARGHVSVDLFTAGLSRRGLARLVRATDALMALTACFFAAMLARGMLAYRADGVRSPVLDWPVWPFMAPGVAALALWALAALLLALRPADREPPRDGGEP